MKIPPICPTNPVVLGFSAAAVYFLSTVMEKKSTKTNEIEIEEEKMKNTSFNQYKKTFEKTEKRIIKAFNKHGSMNVSNLTYYLALALTMDYDSSMRKDSDILAKKAAILIFFMTSLGYRPSEHFEIDLKRLMFNNSVILQKITYKMLTGAQISMEELNDLNVYLIRLLRDYDHAYNKKFSKLIKQKSKDILKEIEESNTCYDDDNEMADCGQEIGDNNDCSDAIHDRHGE